MSGLSTMLLLPLLCLVATATGAGFDGIPGEYCKIRRPTCCPNRDDECTMPILDTLCYCDLFCDRPSDGGDCCPDFKEKCRGVPPPPKECVDGGRRYPVGKRIRRGCNSCECVADWSQPTQSRWRCEEDRVCLIQADLLEHIRRNSSHYTWDVTNYGHFEEASLEDAVYYLGTLFPERSVRDMSEILIKPVPNLPDEFDARQKWPGYIHPIRDQGHCGSSWTFSTTALSADRLAILSHGQLNPDTLSTQQLLSCNHDDRQRGCAGGYLDRAWWYIRKIGLVTDECYPYTSGTTKVTAPCALSRDRMLKAFTTGAKVACPHGSRSESLIYKITPPYRVSRNEKDIMTEIFVNGPVQATFLVHEDFYMYKSGVYQHSRLAEAKGRRYVKSDYHSVRIVGWGAQRDYNNPRRAPIKYWLCANSWGTRWGEDGFFKILRGANHCDIESFVVGVWGKATQQRRRRFKLLRRRVRKRL